MNTILITGINGFLGSYLAKRLSLENIIVGLEYSIENLYRIADCNYKVYSAKDGISEAIFTEQTIDVVIHTATFYGKSKEDFTQMFYSNLFTPLSLLDQAIKYGCKLFVNTDTVLDRFVSPYALTKRQFQEWLYLRRNEIKVINMQLEHFYGPGASSENFITTMISKLKSNEQIINLTLGEQRRNFVYINDVVSAYSIVIKKQDLILKNYSSYQVCTDQLISIKQLMNLMKQLIESSSRLNFGALAYRENELMQSKIDNIALRALGWNPIYTLTEGLKLTMFNS